MRAIRLFWAATLLAVPAAALAQRPDFRQAREQLVESAIVGEGIKNKRVIESIRTTPRHEFVPTNQRLRAYFDMALPIGQGQTISPPFVVAYMTENLDPRPDDKVLEIGTGSGYQAAVLSPLVKEVYTIEIVEQLGRRAASALRRLRYTNVHTKIGDGYKGWPEHAPFDKIIVTCSPEKIPRPLIEQLKEGGRMVIPLGERYQQTLYLYRKREGKLVAEALLPTLFVPMTGTAEDNRQRQPDPLNPQLVNGSFEQLNERSGKAIGWHYQRLLKIDSEGEVPEGKQYVTFSNTDAGRGSHALQAFAVDGRRVRELSVSCAVKAAGVRPGRNNSELPHVVLTFYDERRRQVGQPAIGGWRGTFDWLQVVETVRVPPQAREAIVHIGLLGGTGSASFDNVQIKAAN